MCAGAQAAAKRPPSLADRVDLHDVRAAGEQLARDVGQLAAGDERCLEEGAAAAGEEEDHGVVRGEALHEVERGCRRAEGVFVRNGVSGFVALDARKGMFHVPVLRHDDAVRKTVAQHVACGGGHAPGGLAGGDKPNLAGGVKGGRGEGATHGGVGLHGVDGGRDDFDCCRTEGVHGQRTR